MAPYLLTGSTDSKHYASIVKGGIYRFSPLQLSMKAGDTHRIHGLDERVTVRPTLAIDLWSCSLTSGRHISSCDLLIVVCLHQLWQAALQSSCVLESCSIG